MWSSTSRALGVAGLLVTTLVTSVPSRSRAQFATTPSPPTTVAVCTDETRQAARAGFLATTEAFAALPDAVRVAPGDQPTVAAFVQTIRAQIDEGARAVRAVVDALQPVIELGCPEWAIAAYVRQGEAYELFARAITEATLTPLPLDLQRRMRASSVPPPGAAGQVSVQFDDQVRQVLEHQVRPVECFAIVRYLLAARLARDQGIDHEHARMALARLLQHDAPRIADCVFEARPHAPPSYTPGELGTQRGRWQPMAPGGAPPALAP